MSGDEDRVQHGANHGGGCTLLLRAEVLHFHNNLHILNIQEELLLRKSEGAMARRDYPLLGHGNTGARRVPGPHPADPSRGEPGGAPHGAEAGSDPRGHLGVTWGVYLCAGKPLLADIILSHPPDLT